MRFVLDNAFGKAFGRPSSRSLIAPLLLLTGVAVLGGNQSDLMSTLSQPQAQIPIVVSQQLAYKFSED